MIYKFLPQERIDVLRYLKIRYTPLTSLNDPFESIPLFKLDDLRYKYIKKILYKFNLSEDEAIKLVDDKIKVMPENIRKKIISGFSDSFGVLSLSRSRNNLLMWSHYAQSHTGFVIGFDETHEFFHQNDALNRVTSPVDVTYSDIKQPIDFNDNGIDIFRKMLTQKSNDWAYEQEVRVFKSNLLGLNGDDDGYGNRVSLIDIPPDAITEILIGANASPKFKQLILDHCLDYDVYEAKLSNFNYKLEFSIIKNAHLSSTHK